ncbi:MAG: tetratricopeptide repeat protein [Planctomycetia bacterium]|nr:tetratricopeptide repeat protein [Planctomycetia bacterium]
MSIDQRILSLFLFSIFAGIFSGCQSGGRVVLLSPWRQVPVQNTHSYSFPPRELAQSERRESPITRGQSPSAFPSIHNSIASTPITSAGPANVNTGSQSLRSGNPLPNGNPQGTNSLGNGSSSDNPPVGNDIPKFARKPYDRSLEDLPGGNAQNRVLTSHGKEDGITRTRESLESREKEENELGSKYKAWLESQKQTGKSKDSVPEYLRPLSDDRAVFDDPNSPFARKPVANESDKKFVRQITAADLGLMNDSASRKELLDWEKEQAMPVDWSKYSAGTLYKKWRDWLGMGPDETEAIALMRQAAEEHKKFEETKDPKTLKKAGELYEKAGKKWPDSILEEDALFYAGECRFFIKDYNTALRNYKQLISQYSNSVLKKPAVERLYYIGCYWAKKAEEEAKLVNVSDSSRPTFSTFAGAKKAFEAIYMNDTSAQGRAPDALFALANAYMRRGVDQGDASFESAARYYRQLYEFYPSCKHALKAHQLAMLALHKSYRGPLYDTRPLKQAQEIAEAALRTGQGDRGLINERLTAIKEEQARHLWTRGTYYEKKGMYASARNYYNRLVRDFPDSEFSEEAIVRYQKLESKPYESDQFAWIRPVAPFLPKPKDEYYEEPASKGIQFAKQEEQRSAENDDSPKFSDLDKGEKKKGLF